MNQTEIDKIARKIYQDTAEFYERIQTRLKGASTPGYKILYGPPLRYSPIMFIGEQPGGSAVDAKDERSTWPAVAEYAVASWTLARKMQAMFNAEFHGMLRQCTGTNEIFLRAPSREWYSKTVDATLQKEIRDFCQPRVWALAQAIEPVFVACIGLGTFRRLADQRTVVRRSSTTGYPLVETGTFAERAAVGVAHLTGVPLRSEERNLIADYLRSLVKAR
jgi:hypothetical protein